MEQFEKEKTDNAGRSLDRSLDRRAMYQSGHAKATPCSSTLELVGICLPEPARHLGSCRVTLWLHCSCRQINAFGTRFVSASPFHARSCRKTHPSTPSTHGCGNAIRAPPAYEGLLSCRPLGTVGSYWVASLQVHRRDRLTAVLAACHQSSQPTREQDDQHITVYICDGHFGYLYLYQY